MTTLNSFPTFVNDVDILTEVFGLLVCVREIVGPIKNNIVLANFLWLTYVGTLFFLRTNLRWNLVVMTHFVRNDSMGWDNLIDRKSVV